MGILRRDKNRSAAFATSPCADVRTSYHTCFNWWYSEKFLKGSWDKEECVLEWEKYRECLSQHLDDKHLSRFLEADDIVDFNTRVNSKAILGFPSDFY